MITIYASKNLPPFLNPEWVRDIRALWAAEELGIAYDIHWLDASKSEQRSPEYKAVNPFGIIPAMTDGDFKLFESGAIVAYLCDKAQKLIPAPRTRERALYDQFCFAALNTVEPPVFQLMVATTLAKDAAWAQERAPQLRENALARLAGLETVIAGRKYLMGDDFTGADVIMGQMLNFVADPSLLDATPALKAFHARVKARPAYARAIAKRPATAAAAAAR